jgi:hypothetical protein
VVLATLFEVRSNSVEKISNWFHGCKDYCDNLVIPTLCVDSQDHRAQFVATAS